jgi:exodeoxyribonuclease VII large subunit
MRWRPASIRSPCAARSPVFRAPPAAIVTSRSRTSPARCAARCSAAPPACSTSAARRRPGRGARTPCRVRAARRPAADRREPAPCRAGRPVRAVPATQGALEAEGLFDPARKRRCRLLPRAVGIVTSLGAAALHDVVTCLRRRVPHIPVVLAPAAVQGANAPAELVRALQSLYRARAGGRRDPAGARRRLHRRPLGLQRRNWRAPSWQSPVPLVSGVGHETDFTIADFCADLRAPTPTAAAELVSAPRDLWLGALDCSMSAWRCTGCRLDALGQRLDQAAGRLGGLRILWRASSASSAGAPCATLAVRGAVERGAPAQAPRSIAADFPSKFERALVQRRERLERVACACSCSTRRLVLQRGYAWLTDRGRAPSSAPANCARRRVVPRLADGEVDLTVSPGDATGTRPTRPQ